MQDPNVFLICGTRKHLTGDQPQLVLSALDRLHKKWTIHLLVSGGANGVDSFALDWAASNGVQSASFRISQGRWNKAGAAAGPIRNRMMLRLRPAQVIAFPGGTGTADMVRAAREAGVYVLELRSWAGVAGWLEDEQQ